MGLAAGAPCCTAGQRRSGRVRSQADRHEVSTRGPSQPAAPASARQGEQPNRHPMTLELASSGPYTARCRQGWVHGVPPRPTHPSSATQTGAVSALPASTCASTTPWQTGSTMSQRPHIAQAGACAVCDSPRRSGPVCIHTPRAQASVSSTNRPRSAPVLAEHRAGTCTPVLAAPHAGPPPARGAASHPPCARPVLDQQPHRPGQRLTHQREPAPRQDKRRPGRHSANSISGVCRCITDTPRLTQKYAATRSLPRSGGRRFSQAISSLARSVLSVCGPPCLSLCAVLS